MTVLNANIHACGGSIPTPGQVTESKEKDSRITPRSRRDEPSPPPKGRPRGGINLMYVILPQHTGSSQRGDALSGGAIRPQERHPMLCAVFPEGFRKNKSIIPFFLPGYQLYKPHALSPRTRPGTPTTRRPTPAAHR